MDWHEVEEDNEQKRRRELIKRTRSMILKELKVEEQDEISVAVNYKGYYLQISFSEFHPLMIICLVKALQYSRKRLLVLNELNLKSIHGVHSVNAKIGCYSYRMTHWLDSEMSKQRFFEILHRGIMEANQGYSMLSS